MIRVVAHLFFISFLLQTVPVFAQKKDKAMAKLISKDLAFAASQYKLLAANTPADVMPRTYKNNKLVTSNTEWWTSGFFPGTLWYLYEFTKDSSIKAEAERRLAILEKEKYYTGNHDLGFMIFCSFGNAYRITGKPEYKEVIGTAAETLVKRFRSASNTIQSWGSANDARSLVIIDNMMNLELLNWVSDEWRQPGYKSIAIAHSNATIQNQFRSDNSSYHVVEYDQQTGKVLKKRTQQGYSDESAWARGQAWGLYGFTMMYRFTKGPLYLEQAKKIAAFLLNHPNLPKDKIPYWDFNAPVTDTTYRDVSTASVMASALLELAQYVEGNEKKNYIDNAKKILISLSSPKYKNKAGENGGFVLKHSVGSLPQNSETDVPLTYADYYFVEALLRYKNWYLPEGNKN